MQGDLRCPKNNVNDLECILETIPATLLGGILKKCFWFSNSVVGHLVQDVQIAKVWVVYPGPYSDSLEYSERLYELIHR